MFRGGASTRGRGRNAHVLHIQEHVVYVDVEVAYVNPARIVFIVPAAPAVGVLPAAATVAFFLIVVLGLLLVGPVELAARLKHLLNTILRPQIINLKIHIINILVRRKITNSL